MKFHFLIIPRKQWKIHWPTSYYSMHLSRSLCAACNALEGLGYFLPGLWDEQTYSCFMFPETMLGKAGGMLAGKVQGLLRYNPED